jgi:methyltransferase (TIGR00027 family)
LDVRSAGLPVPDGRSLLVAYILSTHQAEPDLVFPDAMLRRIVPLRADVVSWLAKDREKAMRLMVAMGHRLADDVVVAAVAAGVSQLVVLDAGLSTVCYRRPYPGMRLYEVDLAQTQRWKRQSLAVAGIGVPPSLRYIEIGADHNLAVADFGSGGYDFGASTLVIWLDGTVFLPERALSETLDWLGQHRNRLELVLSFVQPPDVGFPGVREAIAPVVKFMARTADPILSFFDPADVREALHGHGFEMVEHIRWSELLARYRPAATDVADPLGAHVTHAIRLPAAAGNGTMNADLI